MNIHISTEAANWYKNEMLLNDGDCVRFFARYGGFSTVQPGFSLGLSCEKHHKLEEGVKEQVNGITFFIDDNDLWYFDNHDFYVELNEKNLEPEFRIS